jgi:hypothetical protein
MPEDLSSDQPTVSLPYHNNNYDKGLLKPSNYNLNKVTNQSIDVNNLNDNIDIVLDNLFDEPTVSESYRR